MRLLPCCHGTLTILMLLMMLMPIAHGCEEPRDQDRSGSGQPAPRAGESAEAWRRAGGAGGAAVVAESGDAAFRDELEAAIAQAQESATEAREHWLQLATIDRERWLIKWAAPIRGGDEREEEGEAQPDVEYLWVRPVEWSRFRIEGVLVSKPRSDIGHAHGELVSFPIEELADWVHKLGDDMSGARRGGFTVEVLERHFGTPE